MIERSTKMVLVIPLFFISVIILLLRGLDLKRPYNNEYTLSLAHVDGLFKAGDQQLILCLNQVSCSFQAGSNRARGLKELQVGKN